MRRLIASLTFAGIVLMPAFAAAQESAPDGPVVDVAEVVGVIDRPVERYILERIDAAEREGTALLVFQVDSLGGMKLSWEGDQPVIVRRIASAQVPIGVHIGPRAARAGGVLVAMAQAADLSSIGPSGSIVSLAPVDFAFPDRGRSQPAGFQSLGANAAADQGLVDMVAPGVAGLLRAADGASVDGQTLSLPEDEVTVRFFQPGPIRRLLHTFANPVLVYILLLGGAVLIMFELFQPGFGVAGVTGAIVLAAAGYGITVLPFRAVGLAVFCVGLALLTLDVAVDGLGVPTALGTVGLVAGSFLLLPGGAEPISISQWIIWPSIAASLIMFVPVMTVVTRARKPIAREARARLVGEGGHVRSMLNPEGFVFVDGEIWRARSKDGTRMRVGEDVVVDAIDGAVLIVRAGQAPSNGAGA